MNNFEKKHYIVPFLIVVFINVKAESYGSAFVGSNFIQDSISGRLKLSKAKLLFKNRNHSKSLKLAYELVGESENKRILIESNFLLGEIYENNKDLVLAQKHYWKILKLLDNSITLDYNKSEFDSFLVKAKARSLIKLSKVYNLFTDNEEKIDSSKYFLNELIAINFKDDEIYLLKGEAYNNLFVKEFHQKNYNKSKEYVFKAIEVFKKGNYKYDLSVSYQNLASLYEVLEDSEQAFKTYLKALSLVEEKEDLKTLEYKESLYFNMAWTLYNLKDYKAYEYLEKSYILKDTLVNINLRKELKKIEQIHNIDLIKKQEETKRYELERNIWIIGGIASLIMVSFIYFMRMSKLSRQNLELELSQRKAIQQKQIDRLQIESQEKIINAAIDAKEKERKLIAETLHDNVSAMLSSANLHLKASRKHFTIIPEEIEKTQQIISETSVKVRDLSHNLVPSVLLKFGLEFAIKEVTEKYSNSTIKFVSIASGIKRYNQEFEIKVFNIIQELMNNILKHSKAKVAYVTLEAPENVLQIIVKDNGIGITKGHTTIGIGLHQIRARVRQMKGAIQFESPNGEGTKVVLNIPLVFKELSTLS